MAGVPPRFQFSGLTGGYTYVVSKKSDDGKFVARHTPVPLGTMMALDFGSAERGPLCFKPFDDSHMVALHCPVPEQPEGDYVAAVRLQVFLPQFGLALWTMGGKIAQGAVFDIYRQFQHAREAAEGKLQVCRLRPSRQTPIASRNGELHHVPVLEIVGWIARDEGRFGPRIVQVPLPILPAGPAAPPLPAPEATAEPPQPAIASPTVPAAANDDGSSDVAANDDIFAAMTPIGAKRSPF
jgi:hypothetical protein